MFFFRDICLSALTAGFVAVLVGFASSVAIVFQAALAFGATAAQLAFWMWAQGLGIGSFSLGPSLLWRKPVMVAQSTPSAAVLATGHRRSRGRFDDEQRRRCIYRARLARDAVCRYGWFERLMRPILITIASALLAAVGSAFWGVVAGTLAMLLQNYAGECSDGTLARACATLD